MFDKILILLLLSITFLIVAIIFIMNSWQHYGEKKEKYKSGNYGREYTKNGIKGTNLAATTKKPLHPGIKIKKDFYRRRR
nr:MAG TPA: hypothetical protein [Caudoviricetes sp.]